MLTAAQKANITRKRNKMTAAQKATATRRARKELENRFGSVTAHVVHLIHKGFTTDEIMDETYLWNTEVAAYRANDSRGVYDQILVDNGAVSF